MNRPLTNILAISALLSALALPSSASEFENWFAKAKDAATNDEKISLYSSAINSWSPEDLESRKAAALRSRAWAYYEKKDWNSVVSDATAAIELEPDNWVGYHYRAWAYYFQGYYSAAADDHLRSIDYHAEDPYLYFSAALARNLEGRPWDAQNIIARGLAVDSSFVMLYTEQGYVCLERDEYTNAINWFQAGIDREKSGGTYDMGARVGISIAKWKLDDYDGSLDWYDSIFDTVDGPDSLDIWMYAKRVYTDKQNDIIDQIDEALWWEYEEGYY